MSGENDKEKKDSGVVWVDDLNGGSISLIKNPPEDEKKKVIQTTNFM